MGPQKDPLSISYGFPLDSDGFPMDSRCIRGVFRMIPNGLPMNPHMDLRWISFGFSIDSLWIP